MNKFRYSIWLAVLLIISINSYQASDRATSTQKIYSKVLDETRTIHIRVPADYTDSDRSFAAFYILDGDMEELLDEIRVECDTLKAGGRYILAPGCEFPPNGNLNRMVDLMEGAELHGKYK